MTYIRANVLSLNIVSIIHFSFQLNILSEFELTSEGEC
jgi:hypothetical protein